jgi:hypothetical protein
MVCGYATEPGLSKAKLLLNDTKWVLSLGPDVGLSGFRQILQSPVLGLGWFSPLPGLMATRKVIFLSEISGRFSIP